MTELELRQKVIKTAEAYLGCKESDGSHRKIIDIYNSHKPLAVGYKVTYTDAWCSAFVSAIAILCGLTDIIPTECGCGRHIDLFKQLGIWVEDDGYIPDMGDIILYNWNDSGNGDCTTGASHIGYVVSCNGKTIKVIEGNISNSVGYRTISVNSRYIRGYATPNYASKSEPDDENLVAELMELVKKMVDDAIVQREKALKDNDNGAWSKEAREWAIAEGIITGIGNGPDGKPNYAWEAPVTREQMITILYRFSQKIK